MKKSEPSQIVENVVGEWKDTARLIVACLGLAWLGWTYVDGIKTMAADNLAGLRDAIDVDNRKIWSRLTILEVQNETHLGADAHPEATKALQRQRLATTQLQGEVDGIKDKIGAIEKTVEKIDKNVDDLTQGQNANTLILQEIQRSLDRLRRPPDQRSDLSDRNPPVTP